MADKKISALTSASTPLVGTEVLPIVQSSATVKVAVNDLTVKNIRSNATTGILQVAGPTAATTRVMTTPDANFTAARTDAAQTFIGLQTFGSADVTSGPLGMKGASQIRLWSPTNGNYSVLSNTSGGEMRLATGAGDTLLLDGSTNVNVVSGNVVFNTAGKGIDFSANPSAAGMTSELLNDYEEGTWTPVFADALTGGNASGTVMSGVYTKIGNLVTISFGFAALDASGMTGGNTAYFRSLPFATSATNETTTSPRLVGATFSGYVSALLGNSRSGFYLLEVSSGGAFSPLTVSDLASSDGTVTLQYFV